jgi:hypothetical protein
MQFGDQKSEFLVQKYDLMGSRWKGASYMQRRLIF